MPVVRFSRDKRSNGAESQRALIGYANASHMQHDLENLRQPAYPCWLNAVSIAGRRAIEALEARETQSLLW